MSPERRRTEGRRQGQSAALDETQAAFVRHLALERWRDYEALAETLGEPRRALAEAGEFLGRGAYRGLWERLWHTRLVTAAPPLDARLFAAMESTLAAALDEEIAARRSRGDRSLEEDPEYRAFVDQAVRRLLTEAGAAIGTDQSVADPAARRAPS
jgi:hypothetical protein